MPSNATTHGQASGGRVTAALRAYYHAKERCNNPNVKNWADYGGRGICFLFYNFEQFFAELGVKPKGMTLDRTHFSKSTKTVGQDMPIERQHQCSSAGVVRESQTSSLGASIQQGRSPDSSGNNERR